MWAQPQFWWKFNKIWAWNNFLKLGCIMILWNTLTSLTLTLVHIKLHGHGHIRYSLQHVPLFHMDGWLNGWYHRAVMCFINKEPLCAFQSMQDRLLQIRKDFTSMYCSRKWLISGPWCVAKATAQRKEYPYVWLWCSGECGTMWQPGSGSSDIHFTMKLLGWPWSSHSS